MAALSGAVGWRAPERDEQSPHPAAAPERPLSRAERGLTLALKANLVVLAVAIAVAVALLIAAWQG